MEMSLTYGNRRGGVSYRNRDLAIQIEGRRRVIPASIIGVVAFVLLGSSSVFGQFVVQPMKLEIQQLPGKRMPQLLTVENQSSSPISQVDFRIADVIQSPSGAWVPLEPDDPNVDRSKLRSCADWIRLTKTTMSVGAWQKGQLQIYVTVPAGTRGYYCAAIVAQTQYAAGALQGYSSAILWQFVIPILLEVQGRPMRPEISLTDVGLAFRPSGEDSPPATVTSLAVDNEGGTFSRLEGYVRISGKWAGHWRRITEVGFREIGIIPGANLLLTQDVGRPLPAGQYKVEGFLKINGQPGDQIDKTIDFKGDPRAISAKADAMLDLSPLELTIEGAPGVPRTSRILVANSTEEPVTVDVDLTLPEHFESLAGKDANGRTVLGED
jgi:hypothetical protein